VSIPEGIPADRRVVEAFNEGRAEADSFGRIVWSSVQTPPAPIPLADVKAVLDSVALGDFCPAPRAPADVFRTTSTDLFKTPREVSEDGTTVKITLKDVTTNPNEIVRRVVVEHRDGGQQRLYFGQTWDIRFNKEFHKIDLYPINADADGVISSRDRLVDPRPGDDLVTEIRAAFTASLHAVHPGGLRDLIQNVLGKAQAVSVRNGGGVYFVPQPNTSFVLALQAAAKLIPGMSVESVIMPNEPDRVEDLGLHLANATATAADELIRKMGEAKRDNGGKIRPSTVASFASQHRAIKDRIATYSELLQDDLADARSRTELLDGLLAGILAA
jgi:hypothetical protein